MGHNEPLPVVEDEDTGTRFLIYATETGTVVELQVRDGTFWATQQQIADAFGVTRQNVSMYIGNIFKEDELDEPAVCKESLRTAADGKRYTTKFYNLNALNSVGYRVGGRPGTLFRIWATDKLIRYLAHGFVVDAKRLKSGNEPTTSPNYAKSFVTSGRPKRTSMPNSGESVRCARITIRHRARPVSSTQGCRPSSTGRPCPRHRPWSSGTGPTQGCRTWAVSWSRHDVVQADVGVAKNYLQQPEMRELNRLTTILLDILEDQLEIGKLTRMSERSDLLDRQLQSLNRSVLKSGGTASHADAQKHAESQYRVFDEARRSRRKEEALRELSTLDASLPKGRRPPPR